MFHLKAQGCDNRDIIGSFTDTFMSQNLIKPELGKFKILLQYDELVAAWNILLAKQLCPLTVSRNLGLSTDETQSVSNKGLDNYKYKKGLIFIFDSICFMQTFLSEETGVGSHWS